MSRRKLAIVLLTLVLGLALFASNGIMAKDKVVFWSFAANNIEEWQARKAEIEKKFGITLVIENVPETAFVETLQATMMAGTDYPDIIEWRIEQNQILDADPKKSLVIPLDKYVKKSKVFEKVPKGRVAWTTYGGHVYGLPHDVHPVVLVYNDTIWKSVGVDVAKIKTWDEFFKAAEKLYAEKKVYALPYDAAGLAATMWMIWQQTGIQVLDEKGQPTLDTPEMQEFVKWWIGKIKSGVMCNWDWGNFGALLANGTMASYTSPDWWISQVDAAVATGKYQFRVRDLPLYKEGGPRTSSWGGSFMAITRLAKKPDRLYKIIEYMQYDEEYLHVRFKDAKMLPPLSSVWDHEVFKQPDSRFGGQKLGLLQVELAKEVPWINTGDIFWDAVSIDFNTQFTEIAAGNTTVEKGLKEAQARALKRLK
jgi:arabinosaccharide transport system substrate-binding protein